MRFEGLYSKLAAEESAGNAEISSEPAYMELQVVLEGKAGSQMGEAVIAPQPPDFKKALDICTDLLGQSRHISLFVALSKAAAGNYGFQGLADALSLSHSIFSEQWDIIHPQADKDDPDDLWWERKNLLTELTDDPKTGQQLFELKLVSVKHIGAFSKFDIDIASGKKEGSEEDKARCNPNLIRGAFTESNEEDLKSSDSAMGQVIDVCNKLDDLLQEKIGSDSPSFGTLKAQVQECQSVFREYAGDKLSESQPDPEPEEAAADAGVDALAVNVESEQSSTQSTTVVVNSTVFSDRDSVARAFDSVILFYQEFEPSSPVPILLFRARQMVYKNFFDILRELAPQHQDNFRELMSTLKDDPLSFLLEHSFSSFLQGEKFETVSDGGGNEAAGEAQDGSQSGSAAIVVKDRAQVVQTLKDIQKFFEVHEPSSPVPLIVQKVRNLVPKNFMDLLAEFETVADEKPEG